MNGYRNACKQGKGKICYAKVDIVQYKANLITLLMVATLLLQSIGLPFNNKILPIVLVFGVFILFLLIISNAVTIQYTRSVYLLGFLLFAVLSFLINKNSGYVSFESLLYLVVLYSFLIFQATIENNDHIKIIKYFQYIIVIVALAAILQAIVQFGTGEFIDIRTILPHSVLLKGYNTTYYAPVFHILKSDGFFLVEPSFLSQYCAMAIIFEIITFQRKSFLVIFFISIILSFSGTGLLLIIFCLPFIFKNTKRFFVINKVKIIPILVFCSVLIAYFAPAYLARISHQSQIADNSLTVRWIYPVMALHYLHGIHILFGFGPGSESRYPLPYFANFTPLFSVIFQYGIFGIIWFALLIWTLMYQTYRLRYGVAYVLAVFLPYLFLSGALLQPFSIFTIFVLGTVLKIRKNNEFKVGNANSLYSTLSPHRTQN